MRKIPSVIAVTISVLLGSYLALAQNPPAQNQAPPQPMSFFVTSVGTGEGANLGGLAGADATVKRSLQQRTRRCHLARLPQHPGIRRPTRGQRSGPHRDRPLVQLQRPAGRPECGHCTATHPNKRASATLLKPPALTEHAALVNGVGDTPNTHDMLTGSHHRRTGLRGRRRPHLPATGPATPRASPNSVTPTATAAANVMELSAPQQWLQPSQSGGHRRRGLVLLLRHQLSNEAR